MTIYTATGPATVAWATKIGQIKPCDNNGVIHSDVIFSGFGYDLTMRLPDTPSIQNELGVITHRARSNKLYVYRRGARTQEFPLSFSGITRLKFIQIEEFIDRVRGKLIYYTDEWGTKWLGTITTYEPTFISYNLGYKIDIGFSVQ